MDGFLDSLIELLKQAIYTVPVILISLSMHEYAHALVANKMGDYTAEAQGRLTLNPLAHLDPMGTIMMLVSSISGFGFGWAKPVPINPFYFRNRKKGMILCSIAGPVTNFAIAVISAFLLVICMGIFGVWDVAQDMANGDITVATVFCNFMIEFMSINIGFGVFNLLPIPPLDGSKIICGFLPDSLSIRMLEYERYTSIIFVLLVVFKSEWLDMILSPCFLGVLKLIMKIMTPLFGLFDSSFGDVVSQISNMM